MHREPPPPDLEPFVDSRQIPDAIADPASTTEERLLKLGFQLVRALDDFGVPTAWPFVG